MSEASERFERRKQQYTQAFAAAIQNPSRMARRRMAIILMIALLGSTIPISAVSIFFSTICTLSLITISLTMRSSITTKTASLTLLAMSLSIMSGCSPLFEKTSEDILALCRKSRSGSCSYGESIGYTVVGIPISTASLEDAIFNSGAEMPFGVSTNAGHGLISVTKITVYGG